MPADVAKYPQRLSKSRVLAGLQCQKLLWWMVHEPDAPELQQDSETQAMMDRGTRVGQLARTYVPGGVLIDLPYDHYGDRVIRTNEALQDGAAAVYEASFRADNVFVAVDILKREDCGFRLIEVKSSKSVKNHHISDVAVQAYVLRQNGIDVVCTELMYLNGECTFPDLSTLFIREDVTSAVHAMEASVPTWIADQLEMLQSTVPDVKIGPHCTAPYECPFIARCWPRLPPNHVSTLYAMKRRALELDEQGYRTIYDLPEDVPLKPITDRQRRAVREDRMIVEPTLARALDFFVPPIAFIDFETVGLAIPVWNGCHPYDAVPVQFSCHLQQVDGHVAHHAWLSGGPEDPRPRFAERLIAACEGAQTVVAYNTSFERNCLEQLADALPALAPQLQNIAGRLVDLLPIVREHVYHPNFGGSFTLKSVLPALLPEVTYEDLAIADGATASLELERLLLSQNLLTREAKEELRKNLLRYCEQDSWALVKLLERFRQLVGDQQAK